MKNKVKVRYARLILFVLVLSSFLKVGEVYGVKLEGEEIEAGQVKDEKGRLEKKEEEGIVEGEDQDQEGNSSKETWIKTFDDLKEAVENQEVDEIILGDENADSLVIEFYEAIEIDRSLTIRGAEGKKVILNTTSAMHFKITGPVDVSFINLEFFGNGKGGGIRAKDVNLRLESVEFKENYEPGGYSGGAIYIEDGNLEILDSTFEKNEATYLGGAIYSENTDIKIVDSKFEKNKSSSNGGVIYSEDGNLEILDSKFEENKSESSGGAIYKSGGGFKALDRTAFIGNQTRMYGGAINYAPDIENDTVGEIGRDVVFEDNSAGVYGGAIDLALGRFRIYDGVIFKGNTADEGGALKSGNVKELSIEDNVVFEGNFASRRGGAIYAYGGRERGSILKIADNVSFLDNSISWWDGAAIYCKNLTTNLDEVYFENNMKSDGVAADIECREILIAKDKNIINLSIKNSTFKSDVYEGAAIKMHFEPYWPSPRNMRTDKVRDKVSSDGMDISNIKLEGYKSFIDYNYLYPLYPPTAEEGISGLDDKYPIKIDRSSFSSDDFTLIKTSEEMRYNFGRNDASISSEHPYENRLVIDVGNSSFKTKSLKLNDYSYKNITSVDHDKVLYQEYDFYNNSIETDSMDLEVENSDKVNIIHNTIFAEDQIDLGDGGKVLNNILIADRIVDKEGEIDELETNLLVARDYPDLDKIIELEARAVDEKIGSQKDSASRYFFQPYNNSLIYNKDRLDILDDKIGRDMLGVERKAVTLGAIESVKKLEKPDVDKPEKPDVEDPGLPIEPDIPEDKPSLPEEKPDLTDEEEGKLNREDHIAYIKGYKDNTVRPEDFVSREEVAMVFYRLLDKDYRDKIYSKGNDFIDMGSNRWSNEAVSSLVKGEIIKGYGDSSFKPEASISRAEVAAIASRFDSLEVGDMKFTDIDGHWAMDYIRSAAEKGWVKGYEDGSFRPEKNISRAEFVSLVNGVLDRRIRKENIPYAIKYFIDLDSSKWYYEDLVEASNEHLYERLEDGSEKWLEIID